MNQYLIYLVVIVAIVITIISIILCNHVFGKNYKSHGSYILEDDKTGYPNLLIFMEMNNEIVVGVFDKNMTDFIGHMSRKQLVKEILELPNAHNFDNMTQNEFVSKFGATITKEHKDKMTPEQLYNNYKSFVKDQVNKRAHM